MDADSSIRIATVNTLLDGYGSLSVTQLLKPLSANFRHQVLPESLQMGECDRATFGQKAEGIFGIFDKFRMVPQSMAEDEKRSIVVVHAHMEGIFKGGSGHWKNECILMIHLSEDGSEVVRIQEFVDSSKAMEMRQKHAPKHFGGATLDASYTSS